MNHGIELAGRVNGVDKWRHRGTGLEDFVRPFPVALVAGFSVVNRLASHHEMPGHTRATHIFEHLMFARAS